MNKERLSLLPEMPKKEDPADIKAAKISRIIDLPQIGAGIGMIAFGFFPAIGVGLVAFNGATYYVTGKYIERRTKGKSEARIVPVAA